MARDEIALELVAVSKQYGKVTALRDVSLSIGVGEFVVLLGPSGCGKSTILKLIAGIEDATSGEIYIHGRLANYLRPKQRDVSMVFQNYALYPHMTVRQNIGFPLQMRKVDRIEVSRQVGDVARLLGLSDFMDRLPAQLSGGQRQRVALGRAIIRNPVAFLMDEPLSNLDALLRVQMREELLRLHRRVGKTTVYVTHDQVEAMTMADRVVVLREGVVQQVGSKEDVYTSPANVFVATFVGSPQMNFLPGVLERRDGQWWVVGPVTIPLGPLPLALEGGTAVIVGIRPEHIVITGKGTVGSISGRVDLVEMMGSENYVSLTLAADRRITIRTRPDLRLTEGSEIWCMFPAQALHLFRDDGDRNRVAIHNLAPVARGDKVNE
jgi:ABC-type sugar transport system ATPase subunit